MEGTHDHEVDRANLGGGVPPSGPHGNGDSAPLSGLGGPFQGDPTRVRNNLQQNNGQGSIPPRQRRGSVGDHPWGPTFNYTSDPQTQQPLPQAKPLSPPPSNQGPQQPLLQNQRRFPIPNKPPPTPGQARQQVPPQQQQWRQSRPHQQQHIPPQHQVPAQPPSQVQPQGQAAQSQAQAQPKKDKPSFLGAATRTALRTVVSAVAIPTIVVPATVLLFTLSFITQTVAGVEVLGRVWDALEESTIVQNEVKGSKEDVEKLFDTMCETVCYCFLGIVGESVGESEENDDSTVIKKPSPGSHRRPSEEEISVLGDEKPPVPHDDSGNIGGSERRRRFADTPVPNLGPFQPDDLELLKKMRDFSNKYHELLHEELPLFEDTIRKIRDSLAKSPQNTEVQKFVNKSENNILDKLEAVLRIAKQGKDMDLNEWTRVNEEASKAILEYQVILDALIKKGENANGRD